ncbi:MAG: type I-B CRISPR-associated protein Cas7/Cst2/DevR [Planctomycetes bacterium]|nr:type I-B CRISPR-associated protein Cas7/Cst2/DevR [Planctomycetota bacterium]
MTMHVFGTVLTAKAVAANNRGENEGGTVSTLQKIIRNGDIYSTVSAEAIRYALREVWQQDSGADLNRTVSHRGSTWKDAGFGDGWENYVDNDVLGYMHAQTETLSRRGILEITRAVSTSPWPGTLSHNFASPGANPMGNPNPIPYQVEIHDTRYQYSFAMTPEALQRDRVARTQRTLEGIQNLRRVAGNHARFLFDFSPEAIVLRLTADPAPRMLLCFDEGERGNVSLARLVARLQGETKDIDPAELIVGSVLPNLDGLDELQKLKVKPHPGIKAAVAQAIALLRKSLSGQ